MKAKNTMGWKPGLPPGPMSEVMLLEYEVYFSPGGYRWHRKRTETEKKAMMTESVELKFY